MSHAAKIRRDDEVVVISGKDRGKTGTVLRVDPKKQRVYVEGLNIVKRHQRPQQVRGAQRAESVGGTLRIDATPGRGTLVRAVLPAVVG